MTKKDPYKILGVKKNASKEEIKKVFRTRAKKMHPDKGGDAKIFAEMSSAYSLLIDETRRTNYDTTGETETQGEDVIRNRAFSAVGSLFISFVSQAKVGWKNKQVKIELINHLTRGRVELQNQLAICEKEIEFWNAVKVDVVCAENELDPIGTALDEKIRTLSIQKLSAELELKVIAMAVSMIKTYNFKRSLAQQFLERTFYAQTSATTQFSST